MDTLLPENFDELPADEQTRILVEEKGMSLGSACHFIAFRMNGPDCE